MINALMPKEKDLIVAKWFPKDGAMEQGKIIKVKFYTDWRELREQPVQNLMSAREESEVETAYSYPYAKDDKLFFAESWWLITEISKEFDTRNGEKSLGLSRVKYAAKRVRLKIIKVEKND